MCSSGTGHISHKCLTLQEILHPLCAAVVQVTSHISVLPCKKYYILCVHQWHGSHLIYSSYLARNSTSFASSSSTGHISHKCLALQEILHSLCAAVVHVISHISVLPCKKYCIYYEPHIAKVTSHILVLPCKKYCISYEPHMAQVTSHKLVSPCKK